MGLATAALWAVILARDVSVSVAAHQHDTRGAQFICGDLRDAEKTCAIAGKRLCVASEWREACEQTQKGRIALKNILGDWEWTASIGKTFPLSAILLGEKDCASERLYQPWKSEAITGRCCK